MIKRVLAGIVGALALGLMPGQALAADSGEFRWGYQDHYRCVWHCEVRGRFFRPRAGPTPKPTKVPKQPTKTSLTSPVTVSSIGSTANSKTGQTTGSTTAPTTSSSTDPCIGLGFFSQIYCSIFGARPTWASAPPAASQTPAGTGTWTDRGGSPSWRSTREPGVDRHYGWHWDDCRLRDGGWYRHHDWCWHDPWYWHGPLPWPDPWDHHGWHRPRYGHDWGRDSGGSGYTSHRHHPRGRDF